MQKLAIFPHGLEPVLNIVSDDDSGLFLQIDDIYSAEILAKACQLFLNRSLYLGRADDLNVVNGVVFAHSLYSKIVHGFIPNSLFVLIHVTIPSL